MLVLVITMDKSVEKQRGSPPNTGNKKNNCRTPNTCIQQTEWRHTRLIQYELIPDTTNKWHFRIFYVFIAFQCFNISMSPSRKHHFDAKNKLCAVQCIVCGTQCVVCRIHVLSGGGSRTNIAVIDFFSLPFYLISRYMWIPLCSKAKAVCV